MRANVEERIAKTVVRKLQEINSINDAVEKEFEYYELKVLSRIAIILNIILLIMSILKSIVLKNWIVFSSDIGSLTGLELYWIIFIATVMLNFIWFIKWFFKSI